MANQIIRTDRAPQPLAGYSQAVKSGGFVFVAGSSLDKAVSATFILAEEADFAGMNEEWACWFPSDPTARQGAKLPIRPKGIRISIALVAEA